MFLDFLDSIQKRPVIITQEKIIERIRHASTSLTFNGKRWQHVSESAKQLLRGLLTTDPNKRMKLRDLCRHPWIKTLAGSTLNHGSMASTSNSTLLTTKILNKQYQKLDGLAVAIGEAVAGDLVASKATANGQNNINYKEEISKHTLRSQFSRAFEAFHAAEEKGLFTLKDVLEASSLAQRRHQKRSTSSNASSESNISSNSICSSLSTSTTSINTTTSGMIHNTPTKKCPQSCGKPSEPMLFTFNDQYVNEYLRQQQHQMHNNIGSGGVNNYSNNQVLNRPITRSITHHNNKLNDMSETGSDNSIANPASVTSDLVVNQSTNILTGPVSTQVVANSQEENNRKHHFSIPNISLYKIAEAGASSSSSSSSCYSNSSSEASSHAESDLSGSGGGAPSSINLAMPPTKRMKRCSTILID